MSLIPSCKDITEHSSDYLDKNLTLWERTGFRMHLFMCVHCKQYVENLKLTIATLGTLGKHPEDAPREVDPQQVQNIVSHLRQHAGQQPPRS